MSSGNHDARTDRLIRALDAELAETPDDDALPPALERGRQNWLTRFRAGALPFQQDEPVPDAFELEHWLLLQNEPVFRSPGAPSEALRAQSEDGVVVQVQRTDDGPWQVRLRKAQPGRYRVDLKGEDGVRASAEVTVTDSASGYLPVPGLRQRPVRVQVVRLAS